MKLFFTVFAAILAAAAVIMTGIWTKARLDQWEYVKQMCQMEFINEAAKLSATVENAEARRLASGYNVAVTESVAAEVGRQVEKSTKRQLELNRKLVTILENKPFGIPLTSEEQANLAASKTDIEKLENPTPTPINGTLVSPANQDESMKPTTGANEAERQRRRAAQQREAQEIYPRAKAVSPEEMAAPSAPTPH